MLMLSIPSIGFIADSSILYEGGKLKIWYFQFPLLGSESIRLNMQLVVMFPFNSLYWVR